MAGSRTLKLSILGDVDNLTKSLKTATADVETFGDKMGNVGKVIGAAFVAAAAGAYAVKIGIDGVKAALEDEKAQRILALTLENTTGATNAQIAAVEDYITKTALATGVTDDQLRPALSRLVRSTKDTEEAQKLLALALDISSATGKPLEAIANSLGKAYDGNTNALGKLGLGIDQSILKTKDFNKVYESLRGSFAGFAEQEANTFQGRLDRLNVAFDEAKETIGFALLPVLEKLITFINDNALPIINTLSDAFSSNGDGLGSYITEIGNLIETVFTPIIKGLLSAFNSIKSSIDDNLEAFKTFGAYIETYLAPIVGTILGGAFTVLGKIVSGLLTLIGGIARAINAVISTTIDAINALIKAYNKIPFLPDVSTIRKPTIPGAGGSNPPGSGAQPPDSGDTTTKTDTKTKKDQGGQLFLDAPTLPKNTSTAAITAATSGAATAAEKIANAGGTNGVAGAGTTDSQNWARLTAAAEKLGGAATDSQNAARLLAQTIKMGGAFTDSQNAARINITINGAMDKEGTARTLVETLNNAYYRGTGGANSLVGI